MIGCYREPPATKSSGCVKEVAGNRWKKIDAKLVTSGRCVEGGAGQAGPGAVMPEALRWSPVERPAAEAAETTRSTVLELPTAYR